MQDYGSTPMRGEIHAKQLTLQAHSLQLVGSIFNWGFISSEVLIC
jgi:hypothetical protein